jgi:hypothetical protein
MESRAIPNIIKLKKRFSAKESTIVNYSPGLTAGDVSQL